LREYDAYMVLTNTSRASRSPTESFGTNMPYFRINDGLMVLKNISGLGPSPLIRTSHFTARFNSPKLVFDGDVLRMSKWHFKNFQESDFKITSISDSCT